MLIRFTKDCQQVERDQLFPQPRREGEIVDVPTEVAAQAIRRGVAVRYDAEISIRIPDD